MRAPVKQMLKREVEWLGSHSCKHGHSYLEHYNCFLEEKPEECPFQERIGFLDIESSDLNANFGYVFSYCIKELDGPIIKRVLSPKEIRSYVFDKKLMQDLCNDIKKFHRVVVYYGGDRRFDLPFLRTRALKYGLDFPLYKDIMLTDVYTWVKAKLRLNRNRMFEACRMFGIESKGHWLNPYVWERAKAGHKESLQYILTHNIEDVESLEELYKLLAPYCRKGKTSI